MLGETMRDGAPDAARRAGDDRDFAGQIEQGHVTSGGFSWLLGEAYTADKRRGRRKPFHVCAAPHPGAIRRPPSPASREKGTRAPSLAKREKVVGAADRMRGGATVAFHLH